MGFIFGLVRRLIRWSLYLAVFVAIILLIPNLSPYSKFSSIILEPTQPPQGPLAPNQLLNNAQKLYKEKLLGPEAFQLYNGEVYTSLATGEIVKLSPGGHVTFVTKIGKPCTGLFEEEKCGRPLDFKIDENENKLIIADAYYGIWKIDLKTDKKQLLVSPQVEIDGRSPRLFNSIALYKNGDFFWTDSCDFQLKDGAYCILTDPSGRLFHYNAAKNESKVLIDGLWFANGVAVSPDQQFVIVAETGAFRLQKHYIAGPKKGKTEIFAAGLPGSPDNVRALPDGSGALVALYTVFDAEHPLLSRSLAPTPSARKLITRLARLVEAPIEYINSQFPHIFFQNIIYGIGNFQSLVGFLPPKSGLLHIDWNGNIVASYFNTDKSVHAISDAIVFNDKLYMGCPNTQDFVAAVPAPEGLKKAFASVKKASVKVENAKPQEPKTESAKKPEPVKQAPVTPPQKPQEKDIPKLQKKVVPEVKVQQPQKPTITQKPTQQQVKATELPKTTTPKPAVQKPKSENKPAESQPLRSTQQQSKETVKPTTPPPKPAEKKLESAKPSDAQETKSKTKTTEPEKKKVSQKNADKKLPEQIPITEEIPSDTAKPAKESLKVIKREGPAEIPNLKV